MSLLFAKFCCYGCWQAVRDWGNINVIEWMAAVNLSNYVEKFKVKKVDGATLINLDDEKLRVSVWASALLLLLL